MRRGETVLVGDVANDPRYLTTFGSTRSEIVVPILDSVSGHPRGTLDVESERPDAFGRALRRRDRGGGVAVAGIGRS